MRIVLEGVNLCLHVREKCKRRVVRRLRAGMKSEADEPAVDAVDGGGVYRLDVGLRGALRAVPHAAADDADGHVAVVGKACP